MKITIIFMAMAAMVAATCTGPVGPTSSCDCPNLLADLGTLTWESPHINYPLAPGSVGNFASYCGVTTDNVVGGMVGQTTTWTTSFPGTFVDASLMLKFDNNLEGCTLNGVPVPGTDCVVSGHCAHVQNCYTVAVDLPGPINTLSCSVRDYGVFAYFDAGICGTPDPFGPLNPNDPECRQVYLGDDGLLHLVNRTGTNGIMGCLTDAECIEHTHPSSWCTDDGTCHGCDDWEGCCDLHETDPDPLNPGEPLCRQKYLGSDGLLHLMPRNDEGDMGCLTDQECIDTTGPSSYCKNGDCHGCDDWEGCCDLGYVGPADECDNSLPSAMSTSQCRTLLGCLNTYCKSDNTCQAC